MASMWDTFGYRGEWRGHREYINCKEAKPMYQGSRPIDPGFLGKAAGGYEVNPVVGQEVRGERRGLAYEMHRAGEISPDVRIFNLFTPQQTTRRPQYQNPAQPRMMTSQDYAASIVASGIGVMHGGE